MQKIRKFADILSEIAYQKRTQRYRIFRFRMCRLRIRSYLRFVKMIGIRTKKDYRTKIYYREVVSMYPNAQLQNIMAQFGLSVRSTPQFYDTSHSEDNKRLNYIWDRSYVLKIHSAEVISEARLQEIGRLVPSVYTARV